MRMKRRTAAKPLGLPMNMAKVNKKDRPVLVPSFLEEALEEMLSEGGAA